jgi:hypothetical protein
MVRTCFQLWWKAGMSESVDVDAVPLPENHGARVRFGTFIEARDEVLPLGTFDQPLHLIAMIARQLLKAVNPFVDMGQRQQVEQRIERRQQPKQHVVAEEIQAERGEIELTVTAYVVKPARQIDQREPRQDVGNNQEQCDRQQDLPGQQGLRDLDQACSFGTGGLQAHAAFPGRLT